MKSRPLAYPSRASCLSPALPLCPAGEVLWVERVLRTNFRLVCHKRLESFKFLHFDYNRRLTLDSPELSLKEELRPSGQITSSYLLPKKYEINITIFCFFYSRLKFQLFLTKVSQDGSKKLIQVKKGQLKQVKFYGITSS